METHYSQLSEHLYIHHGHVNIGIIRDANRALLIDPSGASLQTTLTELGITDIDQILYTHHHRDNTAGFPIPENTRIGVPAAEAQWFSEVETFWNDPKYRWHLYNCHPHNLMLVDSMHITDTYTEGAKIVWGPVSILMGALHILLMLTNNVSLFRVISSTMKVKYGNFIAYKKDSRLLTITDFWVRAMN